GATSGNVPVTLAYDSAMHVATLSSSSALASDHYTVTVSDNVTSVISGKRLDGEIASPPVLPSGNGIPGGAGGFAFDVLPSPADINGDGAVNSADLSLFVQVLLGLNTNPTYVSRSDFNADGTPDGADIPGFIAAYY